ncbi:MAG: histidine kinase [Chitinophagaceae bacterium]|nr:histidine kinase [Chitinophagaceae bacterium]
MTTPFMAIMGATPGFIVGDFHFGRTLAGVSFIIVFSSVIWVINTSLLLLSLKSGILTKNWMRLLTASVLVLIIVTFVFFVIKDSDFIRNIPRPVTVPPFSNRFVIAPISQALAINVVVFVLIELLMLREQKNKVSVENEQLKLANMEAKVNSLKEQLHPHFLFNSLSTLRSLITRSPEKAEIYLEQLSELLRFSTNNSKAVIPLSHEIELCKNYLTMQKVRFGDSLDFNINIPEAIINNIEVPVYSLQQLAENAIKHNILTKELPLFIDIYYNGITNEIVTVNNLQPKNSAELTSATGLANLNERYRLLGYEGINIQKSETKFSVGIQLIAGDTHAKSL